MNESRTQMNNTVIYHRADFDGLFSAAVCKKFLPESTEFVGWDFGDDLIPFPDGRVFLVDLPPSCFTSIPADATRPDRFIWIDHHKSSIIEFDEQLGHPFNGYLLDGVAACRLCYQWFMAEYASDYRDGLVPIPGSLPDLNDFKERRVHEPLALTLAGEYDVWDLHDERAIPFQFGLTAGGYSIDDGLLSMLDRPNNLDITGQWVFPGDVEVHQIVANGYAAMNWQRQFASQVMRERSYRRDWEGLRFAVLGSAHTRNSMWFPENEPEPEVQALMCWRYDGKSVKFSLYHAPGHEDHDLSLIAKKYGGGGHRGACGFEMDLEHAMEIIR